MDWKLIFSLSLFGLAMAFATVFFISPKIEPFCWLVIFLICARQVAENAYEKYFLHGFSVGMLICVWMLIIHGMLLTQYALKHGAEVAKYTKMHVQMGIPVTMAMCIVGILMWLISSCILGLFSFIASKIF